MDEWNYWPLSTREAAIWGSQADTHKLTFSLSLPAFVLIAHSRGQQIHHQINQTRIYGTVGLLLSYQSVPGVRHSSQWMSRTHMHKTFNAASGHNAGMQNQTRKRNSGNNRENKPTKPETVNQECVLTTGWWMPAAVFMFTRISSAVYERGEIRARGLPWEQTDRPGVVWRRPGALCHRRVEPCALISFISSLMFASVSVCTCACVCVGGDSLHGCPRPRWLI